MVSRGGSSGYYANEVVLPTDRYLARHPANRGFKWEEIRALLKQLEARGVQLELVETSSLSDEARMKAYVEAVMPAVRRKSRVRRVFGNKRRPGSFFGKGVQRAEVVKSDHKEVRPMKMPGTVKLSVLALLGWDWG